MYQLTLCATDTWAPPTQAESIKQSLVQESGGRARSRPTMRKSPSRPHHDLSTGAVWAERQRGRAWGGGEGAGAMRRRVIGGDVTITSRDPATT